MASLGSVEIRTAEYRPCHVNGKKALFHRWGERAQVIGPSLLRGGHPGGQLHDIFAVVEYEDGKVQEVTPESVCFVPGLMYNYCFGEGHNETRNDADS